MHPGGPTLADHGPPRPAAPDVVALVRDWFEYRIPFHRLLGVKVDRVSHGRVVVRVPWKDELIGDPRRPAVHGGVISAAADATGGAACLTRLESPDDRLSTVDLRVDYLQPGPPVDLLFDARVVRLGNRVAVARTHVYASALPPDDDHEQAIATAQAVYNVVRR